MFVKFVGDPEGDPKKEPNEITNWGITFPRGKDVEVTDEAIVKKASLHSHFEVSAKPVVPPKVPDPPKKS